MKKIIVVVFALICNINIFPQSISIGIGGKYLPSFSESRNKDKADYNTLLSYGGKTIINFKNTLPFAAGLQINYGYKQLANNTLDLGQYIPGSADRLIASAKREISILEIAVPVQYRLADYNLYKIDAGLNIGARKMNFSSMIRMQLSDTGVIINSDNISKSNWEFYFAPFIEFGLHNFSPIIFYVGINYEFYETTFHFDNNIDGFYNSRPDSKFQMNGIAFTLSAMYLL